MFIIAELKVTLNTNVSALVNGRLTYQEFVARGKQAVLTCTAHVPQATLTW